MPTKNSTDAHRGKRVDSSVLSAARLELIDYFEELARTFSLPPSIGQIYGLLFSAEASLPFDAIWSQLQISKASASSGLKLLVNLGAISVDEVPEDRRTFYRAQTSIRQLIRNFLEAGVEPQLVASEAQLDAIAELIADESPSGESLILEKRIASLRAWHQKARKVLPWLNRLTSPRKKR